MKDFLMSLLGGAMGAAAAITLSVMLPRWLYLSIGVVCCAAILIEIGALGCCIVRKNRVMKEELENERMMKEVMEVVERRNR